MTDAAAVDLVAMGFRPLPPTAAWRYCDSREGFEVAYFERVDDGHRIVGCTSAIEDGHTFVVDYVIGLDRAWRTRSAHIRARSIDGPRSIVVEADGAGHWTVDGTLAPHLDGCLDVDLDASAMTNALPVHRLAPAVGERVAAPAAYVRAPDLAVQRLEQVYERVADEAARQCYDYEAPLFAFAARLVYDEAGLVLDYPGIATRAC